MLLTSLLVLLFIAINTNAQDKTVEDFFVGKWKFMVYGLPQGDVEMVTTIENKDGKLGGSIYAIQDSTQVTVFSKVELKEKSLTAYYTAQGYDVYFVLEKGDGEKVTGSMMDMFDMKGTKIKK
jgi:hypothetical protein